MLGPIAAAVIVVALVALQALRMRQAHELALIAARPAQSGPDAAALVKLEERVTVLERNAALASGRKRRA